MGIWNEASPTVLLASLAVGLAVAYAAFKVFPRKKKYRYVGTIQDLFIYPVKSLKAIRVKEAECTKMGLRYKGFTDRHWAISTSNGSFLTQRGIPRMALIEPSMNGDLLQLNAPGMEPISLHAFPEPNEGNLKKITVWGDSTPSVDLGDEVGNWLSKFLNKEGVRMHYSAPSLEKRDCNKILKKSRYPVKPKDLLQVAYPDSGPYMILSNESIALLNTKLENEVTVLNFRPNILVKGFEAFAEDAWKNVQIGDAAFRALDHCRRCILTTVDPQMGVKDAKGEPLKTLKKFRIKAGDDNDPCFGMIHCLDKVGTIKVGDPVYALDG